MTTSTDNLAAPVCLSLSRSPANYRIQIKGLTWFPQVNIFTWELHHPHCSCCQGIIASRESTPSSGCTALPGALPATAGKRLSNISSWTSWTSRAQQSPAELGVPAECQELCVVAVSDTDPMSCWTTRSELLPTAPSLMFFNLINRLLRVSPPKGNSSKGNI